MGAAAPPEPGRRGDSRLALGEQREGTDPRLGAGAQPEGERLGVQYAQFHGFDTRARVEDRRDLEPIRIRLCLRLSRRGQSDRRRCADENLPDHLTLPM